MKAALLAVSFSALLDRPQSDGLKLSRLHPVALRRFLTPGITRRALNSATAKFSTRAALFAVGCMPLLCCGCATHNYLI